METFNGLHECEIFAGSKPEAAESEHHWVMCEKNPGHKKFIAVSDYVNNYLPKIQNEAMRVVLRNWIDRTVRLRVRFTSLDRPDDDEFSDDRGTNKLRAGTGYIWDVKGPVCNRLCPCNHCERNVTRKYWNLYVSTAQHVVYDTREAKSTLVDLFYDDADSQLDGRMKSLRGMEVPFAKSDRDCIRMLCVTCDENLVSRIMSASRYLFNSKRSTGDLIRQDTHAQNLLPHRDKAPIPAMVVSHPHAQPKLITLGELKHTENESRQIIYNTPTCPGSSGAPVLLYKRFRREAQYLWQFVFPTHNGSYLGRTTDCKVKLNLLERLLNKCLCNRYKLRSKQINYGHFWL